MKTLRLLCLSIVLLLAVSAYTTANAQCAVCSTNVATNAKSGDTTTKGLNNGIIYLLFAPYLAVGIVAYIWYKQYRRKNVSINMRDDKLHLN